MGIKKLTPEVTEQIAAGEVVENPASIIKELVENSLDAGATLVEIKVSEGGLKEIRVTDNGVGIPSQEASLAFERHATSKISTLDNLLNIQSLGFRGEALASIGAVSRVTMVTKTEDRLSGSCIKFEGGSLISVEETGAPTGTDVQVKDLFYNTPARRKFLKSSSQEMKKISNLIIGFALANPATAFTLWNGEKRSFKSKGDGNIIDIIAEAYGKDVARSMLEINPISEDGNTIKGYISTPHISKSNRQYQTFIVNHRLIRSNLISQSMRRGYEGLLPPNRFPLAVLFLEVPLNSIDVNIHPAKAEIRFSREREIGNLVYKAVTETLKRSTFPGKVPTEGKYDTAANPSPVAPAGEAELPAEPENINLYSLENTGRAEDNNWRDAPGHSPQIHEKEMEGQLFTAANYRIIGQYLSSYIIVQRSDELWLIDQHAAHERIIYEDLKKNLYTTGINSILLVSPLTFEVPFSWEEDKDKVFGIMEEMGFNIEEFGSNTYVIRAVPDFLAHQLDLEYFKELFEGIAQSEEDAAERKNLLLKMAACKGAVKANQKLHAREIAALIEDWEQTENYSFCPHGRPAVVSFTAEEIEKGFKRKGGK